MTGSIPAPERRRRRDERRLVRACAPLLVAALPWVAMPAGAELVVFTDGAVLKVATYRAAGDAAIVELHGGGQLEFDLARIERVVDDEIEPPPPAGEQSVVDAGAGFEVRWRDGQRAPEVPHRSTIEEAARRHGLNPALVAAVARVESAFDERAVSYKGAHGIMQLMPATAARFGLRRHQLFDPELNIDTGARYLAWLAERFDDDLARILAGYNAGEGAVDRYDGVPPYRETRDYVRKVYARLGLAAAEAAGGR